MKEIIHKWRRYANNVSARLAGQPLDLRVLNTSAEREKGFMFEPEPHDGFGLLFIYNEPRELGFWMRNVAFDLDLVPLDSNMKIMGVHRLRAHDERICRINRPCRYVLELSAGWCERNGAYKGDQLQFINV
jgi:uncharacterized membrane protein (UPF0127 family)